MKVRTSYVKFFFFFLVVSVLIHTLLTVNGLKVRKLGEIPFAAALSNFKREACAPLMSQVLEKFNSRSLIWLKVVFIYSK